MVGGCNDDAELLSVVPVCGSKHTHFGTASTVVWSLALHFVKISCCSSRAALAYLVNFDIHFPGGCYDRFSLPVRTEWRRFRGQRDLDYSASRVWWLCTLLHGKAKAQGTRPSKPKKKGTCLIGNSRGIAAQVQTTSVGFRQGIGHLPVSVT